MFHQNDIILNRSGVRVNVRLIRQKLRFKISHFAI